MSDVHGTENVAARARPDAFSPSARWVDQMLRCPATCRLRAQEIAHVHHGPPNNRVTLTGVTSPAKTEATS